MATCHLWADGDEGCLVASASDIHRLATDGAYPSSERLPGPPGTISAIAALARDRSFLVATDRGLFLTANAGDTYELQEVPDDLPPVLFMVSASGDPEAVCMACLGGDIWTCRVSR
jgi:hypothetical protein